MEESEIDWSGLRERMVRFSMVKGFLQPTAEEFAEEVVEMGRKQIKKIPNMELFNYRLKHWWVNTSYKNIKKLYSEPELIKPNKIKDFEAKVQDQIDGGKTREEAEDYVRIEETLRRRPHSIKTDWVDNKNMPTIENLPNPTPDQGFHEKYEEHLEICLEIIKTRKPKLYDFLFMWAYKDLEQVEIAKIVNRTQSAIATRKKNALAFLLRCIVRRLKEKKRRGLK